VLVLPAAIARRGSAIVRAGVVAGTPWRKVTSPVPSERTATFVRERRVAHPVHAAMQAVQPTGKHASPHRIITNPDAAHLGYRDDTVLPLRKLGDQSVGWGDFSVHFTDKSSHPPLSPPRLGDLAACGC
jgi:hypothetical protein